MLDGLHIEGDWPGPMTIRRSWAKATARPWNDDLPNPMLKLERGGYAFLRDAARRLVETAGVPVYSPALYETTTRVWERAGFRAHVDLPVMERSILGGIEPPMGEIHGIEVPDLERLADLDSRCFEGFWRMSALGLQDALDATPRAVVLVAKSGREAVGYSLVGAQLTASFLQRIAVVPEHRRQGMATDLLHASILWAKGRGAQTMVLNVRSDNEGARELYARAGFSSPGSRLKVLEFDQ